MPAPEPTIVHQDDCESEEWDDPIRGRVRFRTMLSGDRTPSEAITMGVAELGPGESRSLRLHRHEAPEAYFILAGTGVVNIDGREHPVCAGSAVFVPGGVRHGAFNTGVDTLRLLYVFAVDSFADVEYEFDTAAS